MIHKIKALHDEGRGLSIRAIGQQLGIARHTVRKYLRQSPGAVAFERADTRRPRRLDSHQRYLVIKLML